MLNRKEIEWLKMKYVSGTKVCLCKMEGEATMFSGCKGTVTMVDDIGQIHVNWENGSSLALDTEVDEFYVIASQEQSCDEPVMDGPR